MSLNHDDDFIFPLTTDVTLVNDFVLRREVLEQLPIPLVLFMDGKPVWKNTWARYVDNWRESAPNSLVPAAADPPSSDPSSAVPDAVRAQFHLVSSLDGQPQATIAWYGNAVAGAALDLLETPVLVARMEEIIWTNRAARRAFGLGDAARWDEVYGFPAWDDVARGAMTRRYGEYRIRYLGFGDYVLVEASRPDAAEDMATIPMDQVASLVHEIRNPLAALSGYIEMGQLEAKPGEHHYFEEMMREIDRLSRFTADLMAVARPITVEPKWTLLDDLVEHAWFAAGRGRRSKKRAVRLKKAYGENERILGDPDRLQQVMTNLVKNAVEALSETGSWVEVALQENDQEWVISVSDDGPGLPADLLGRLFVSRFTTKDSGNGFGLMIVRRVVEAHGGTVRVTVENGTRIDFTIPKPPTA